MDYIDMTPEPATIAFTIKSGQWLVGAVGVIATTIVSLIAFMARRIIRTMDRGLVEMGAAVAGVEQAARGVETRVIIVEERVDQADERVIRIEKRVDKNEKQLSQVLESVNTLTAKLSSQNTELVREISMQGNKATESVAEVKEALAKFDGMLMLLIERRKGNDEN